MLRRQALSFPPPVRYALMLMALATAARCTSDAEPERPDASVTDGSPLDQGTPADGFQSADAAAGTSCRPTGLTDAQATRRTNAASVTADAVLLNAVVGCPAAELRFKLVLDTHSVALDAIDLPASALVETSLGVQVTTGFGWMGGSESSHHRDGVLGVPAPPLPGASWMRLTLRAIGGVDRVFEWDAAALSWAQTP